MILADTSVWINHFRDGNAQLQSLLHAGDVLTHPFVLGELACGSLGNRTEILHHLEALPEARLAGHLEVLRFVEEQRLYGRGIGWIDAHLLASTLLSDCTLWTLDRRLHQVAASLGVAAC